MKKKISHYRKNYQKSQLDFDTSPPFPLVLFDDWFTEVEELGNEVEVNTMTLSTVNKSGMPLSRIVLLKEYSKDGFVFYTNYNSTKGQNIAQNARVCLSFFWASLERQVIIQGKASKVTALKSDAYFSSRPKGSRLGAISSPQSKSIESRKWLETNLKKMELTYKDKEIVRPEHWGGYQVVPHQIEFWQGRPNRLHDRLLYKFDEAESWSKSILAP